MYTCPTHALFLTTIIPSIIASRSDSRYYASESDWLEGIWTISRIGPPNPPVVCLPMFGSISGQTCSIVQSQAVEADSLSLQADRLNRGNAIPQDVGSNFPDIIQYLGPGASAPIGNTLRTSAVPKIWGFELENSACSITLMTQSDPGPDNRDNATAIDFIQATADVINDCALYRGNSIGGYQIYGETNKLAVFIYNPNSEYNDAIDLKHGCVRRGWVKVLEMMRRLGVFDRTCSSAEENDASGGSGDTGPSEIQQHCKKGSLISADVMYGLKKVVDWVVTNCQDIISEVTDVEKT